MKIAAPSTLYSRLCTSAEASSLSFTYFNNFSDGASFDQVKMENFWKTQDAKQLRPIVSILIGIAIS